MKTYKLFYMLLACLFIIGCNTSDDGSDGGGTKSTDADYTILLSTEGMITSQLINADGEKALLNPAQSPFADIADPQLSYREGSILTIYHKKTDCSGEILKYDFKGHISDEVPVFSDLGSCTLTASAVAHSDDSVFIAYSVEESAMVTNYFVRAVDLNASGSNGVDVPLALEPVELVFANDRLFILTFDEISDEYTLTVMDTNTNTLIHDMDLGFSVRRIIKNSNGNLLISYDGGHTLLNSTTMGFEYINYEIGKEPKFADSESNHFDTSGKMYYKRPTGDSTHPNIPAIYDFLNNTAFLYYFENFLTEAEWKFEHEIGNTTMVSYDESNDLLLVGYQKLNDPNKGGLIRIKPAPEPALIDNLDLDGVPYNIFIK